MAGIILATALVLIAACSSDSGQALADHPHGPVAAGIMAPLGEPIPGLDDEQMKVFEAGLDVSLRRFDLAEGLGPAFNVTFCTACHERPVIGGSAGLYRNFFLAGKTLTDGSFVPATSQGMAGGVIRMYNYDPSLPARPELSEDINVVAQRNPIPFFGAGLVAAIPDKEILSRADPDDADGDGISGRANFDRGFVGRFGRKSQTVSIEAFIRGPLFNHLGITTDPLTDEQRARLPVDSSRGAGAGEADTGEGDAARFGHEAALQAAAPDGPLTDADGVADPEMSGDQLFALVSQVMLLAAPELEMPNDQGIRGAAVFDAIGCGACHTPRVDSPAGPLPLYSDLLLHDMGPDLADGISQGDATGSEFRTQPLWGLAAVGPYLHDGRAATIDAAIRAHGGEAQAARDRYVALSAAEIADLEEFLASLGGRSQYSPGLLPVDFEDPSAGQYGAPRRGISAEDLAAFREGRLVFDREHSFADGVGNPGFNGDSCRACHFDPVTGGAGPRDVNVMRHGFTTDEGGFVPLALGTILPKINSVLDRVPAPIAFANEFEHRNTPALFGLGLVDEIDDAVIIANADPDDSDGDGISGRAHILVDGRLGRFGWKADVPSLAEFARDALGAELGFTLGRVDGLTFGRVVDTDGVKDPEFSLEDAERLVAFMAGLAPPPRSGDPEDPLVMRGAVVFDQVGCALCHIPSLPGRDGPVQLYSDLLLHDVAPPGSRGITSGRAAATEFRTAPLWGLPTSAPYMHSGVADTIEEAIMLHHGEAAAVRTAFQGLSADDLAAILAFLNSL